MRISCCEVIKDIIDRDGPRRVDDATAGNRRTPAPAG
jgi:hypothetical protein